MFVVRVAPLERPANLHAIVVRSTRYDWYSYSVLTYFRALCLEHSITIVLILIVIRIHCNNNNHNTPLYPYL